MVASPQTIQAHPAQRGRTAAPQRPISRIVVPIRYAAWLAGDLGKCIQGHLARELGRVQQARVSRLPRALLVEADEEPGPLLEAVERAMRDVEKSLQRAYPVFHHEMGPVWTGTLQAVFVA